MKNFPIISAILLSGMSLMPASAAAQEILAAPKGNVTIVKPYYDEAAALANIETAAGDDMTSTGAAPAVTIVNVPHQPAFDPLKGEWRPDGPVFQEEAEPLSLRDRVRSKLDD